MKQLPYHNIGILPAAKKTAESKKTLERMTEEAAQKRESKQDVLPLYKKPIFKSKKYNFW